MHLCVPRRVHILIMEGNEFEAERRMKKWEEKRKSLAFSTENSPSVAQSIGVIEWLRMTLLNTRNTTEKYEDEVS